LNKNVCANEMKMKKNKIKNQIIVQQKSCYFNSPSFSI